MNWLFRSIDGFSSAQYDAVYGGLSASRKAHVDRMKNRDDRLRSVLAAALVNELLQAEKAVGARLETDGFGKPFLNGSGLFVSISHCEQGVACAVSSSEVGIDLERIRPVRKALIEYVCLPCEKEYVFGGSQYECETVTDPQTLLRFFEVWTAKEAYFKKCGPKDMLAVNTLELEKRCLVQDGFIITII